MSYKKEAASAHKAKVKGYADGGGVEEGPGLLDIVSEGVKQKLASQMGQQPEEGAMPPDEI